MDESITFFTDAATLAIFDIAILEKRFKSESDWWCYNIEELTEVNEGKISIISTGSDGYYKVRITDKNLTKEEHDYAHLIIEPLGIEVISSNIFVGKGECLPSEDYLVSTETINDGDGRIIDIEPGKYNLSVYLINWFDSPKYWNEEYQTPPNAPADIVIRVMNRTVQFPGVSEEPRLVSDSNSFLFASDTRKVGPEAGMNLVTKVWRNQNGLTLKECGPLFYKPLLTNYENIKWKDKIKIKVISVNHHNKTMNVEYIETIQP